MLLERLYDTDLAQASYLIASTDAQRAVVVDPRRDVQIYLDLAAKHGLRITDVTETHIHADYLSGTRELAAATGATIHVSGHGGADWSYGYEAHLLRDGDEIVVGEVRLRALFTPGHTPEHLSYLVTDGGVADEPGYLLSGDFIFAGDLGRPDLLDEVAGGEDTREDSARTMFASVRDRFVTLPDHVLVLPGHGAGSACGKSLGAVPSTTVGYEKRFAWWAPLVTADDEDAFVDRLLHGQPEAHAYFARMKRQNRDGPALRGPVQPLRELDPAEAARRLADGRAVLLDTRSLEEVHRGAVVGALTVPAATNRSTYTAWSYDPEHESTPLILLARDAVQAEELRDNLLRVGIDTVAGYITSVAHLPSFVPGSVAPADLSTHQHDLLLDVRGRDEHAEGAVPGSAQLHGGRALWELSALPTGGRIVVYCQSGLRAGVVSAALRRAGYDITELEGSYAGWSQWARAGR
ncbi:Zn-dependent hydrolase [Brachybacterium sp. P6-10-X1]|uniref:MBL fold metallo-hydrolase n=1 Tax=Brachybacterium sp. P6-10-X1 TaxID=1903186 RepID=UPI000971A810|nr:MBL fold metallo-hydrolase [Brachybacterium sp. P6-10-X1]APX33783.1 Zn-dependent hydrolase [Brachybacterium sp. P6-10-X1]